MSRLEEIRAEINQIGTECWDCMYCHEFEERHPYGEGTAVERLFECTAKPEQCEPALDQLEQEQIDGEESDDVDC